MTKALGLFGSSRQLQKRAKASGERRRPRKPRGEGVRSYLEVRIRSQVKFFDLWHRAGVCAPRSQWLRRGGRRGKVEKTSPHGGGGGMQIQVLDTLHKG